jgi:maltose alpha-D-glucosyltransferase / alpha-amylase
MKSIDADQPSLSDDPLWYRDAVIYELHVRSFFDSNGDGIGDFPGLTLKLDYLEELGITALWILPFYPSPLRDDGYDIADYRTVNPEYGTLEDFRTFLDEAHRRGIRVITELVINHTSDQHPWFQRARRAPEGSPERSFYVWSDDPDRYAEARIIFKDFEPSNWTWDPVAGAYYWHRFYHHQPDLNFDNPVVREELFKILDFWLDMGVDGLRLDAIPYLYQREGTNCENLPETHAFLKELRTHVDGKYRNRMLLAEANQWPEDAAAYFGEGDECHMNFHFPLMPRLFMAARMEDRFPIRDILDQTPEIPEGCQWGLFLRNHDELTLEMVTDEERDYMYRVYAEDTTARINLGIRRRLAPLLNNNRRQIELLNSLLLSLPGTPILYYGDEIGMGDNFYLGDRHGVRTPMQWAGDRNAGFSRANPQKLFLPVIIDPEYHYEAVNVETQHRNPTSLLWWMRRLISLRKRHPALGRGSLEWVTHGNPKVVAFLRRSEDETILVVANLSRFAQPVELELAAHRGSIPLELFGHTTFPTVGDEPYGLTVPAHGFLWFALEPEEALADRREVVPAEVRAPDRVPLVRSRTDWDEVLQGRRQRMIEDALVDFVRSQRWFAGKGRTVRGGHILDAVPMGAGWKGAYLVLLELEYVAADSEVYLVPLTCSTGPAAELVAKEHPAAVAWRASFGDREGLVHDGMVDPEFCSRLLEVLARGLRLEGEVTQVRGIPLEAEEEVLLTLEGKLTPRPGRAEQSNTSVIFGDRWILKLFRRLESGMNPDREIGEVLREVGFDGTPELAGALELDLKAGPAACAVLHRFVPNQGDAWTFTLDALGRYFETGLAAGDGPGRLQLPADLVSAAHARLAGNELPEEVGLLVGPYLESARLLGKRTGELHRALSSRDDLEAFRAEPFSTLYQRSLYQSIRNLLGSSLEGLAGRVSELGEVERGMATEILGARGRILSRFEVLLERRFDGSRIRTHGDYHLGQVLFTGRDFQVIDFEGEPDRALGERRIKRSPLRDTAGMIRSFDYVARSALLGLPDQGLVASAGDPRALELARFWAAWVGVEFLAGYLEVQGLDALLPSRESDRRHLLELFLLEKALYELRYELNNRPDWSRIPLEGILSLMGDREAGSVGGESHGGASPITSGIDPHAQGRGGATAPDELENGDS